MLLYVARALGLDVGSSLPCVGELPVSSRPEAVVPRPDGLSTQRSLSAGSTAV